jgi:hypothetical protein
MVDSHKALSSASPTVPIEPAIPAASSSAVKATETYCDPAMLPCVSRASGRFLHW